MAISLDGVICVCPNCGGFDLNANSNSLNAKLTCRKCGLMTTISKAMRASQGFDLAKTQPGINERLVGLTA